MQPEIGLLVVRQAAKKGEKLLPAVLSRQEIRQCVKTGKSERNQLIIRVFYATGVRLEELSHLVVADIRWDEKELFVRRGKGAKDRLVCLDDGTLALLKEYTKKMAVHRSLFNLGKRQIERIVTECGNMLGLVERYRAQGRRFSPHAFRHSMATHLFEKGMDLFTLKKTLGHDYLDTTEIYVHVSMADVRKAYDKADLFGADADGSGMAFRLNLGIPLGLNLGTYTDPDREHMAQSYRTYHDFVLEAP
jgi:site-specific recombinase XerD